MPRTEDQLVPQGVPPSPAAMLASPLPEPPDVATPEDCIIRDLVGEARELVGMDIAFLSRFSEGHRVIEVLDPPDAPPFHPGHSDPVEDTYCQRIVDGRLPQAIPDTAANPASAALPVTTDLGAASHAGVPVLLDDGTVYGTLCAYSHTPRPVDDRDTAILVLVARSIAQRLSADSVQLRRREAISDELARLLARQELRTVYQPIVDVLTGHVRAVEALTRFPASSGKTPGEWFADALLAGEAETLELAALRCAAQALVSLPLDVALTVNVSPAVVLDDGFLDWLGTADTGRIVLELTEHESVSETAYKDIAAVLEPARRRGIRLAVDDVGAGYASMRHVLALMPDMMKIDISLIRGIDTDRNKRALCQALVTFAGTFGAQVVAEGVETSAELLTVRRLGVNLAQGFFLARPGDLQTLDLNGSTNRLEGHSSASRSAADVVALIHEWTHAGASPATIAARLNATGELTRHGKRWHPATVREALLPRNPERRM